MLEEMWQQTHDDRNEVFSFLNDLRQNQWDILDCLGSIQSSQQCINDCLDQMEGCLAHVELHALGDPWPLDVHGVGHGPDLPPIPWWI